MLLNISIFIRTSKIDNSTEFFTENYLQKVSILEVFASNNGTRPYSYGQVDTWCKINDGDRYQKKYTSNANYFNRINAILILLDVIHNGRHRHGYHSSAMIDKKKIVIRNSNG